MRYLISAWKASQEKFSMNLKQVVAAAGDGDLNHEITMNELRDFYAMIDLSTMERLLDECLSKDKSKKFDTRGFALQDLVNEMGARIGYQVVNGLYKGKKGEVGFDGLWKSEDGSWIIMESKTNDDYSIDISTVTGYRDKLIYDHAITKKKCSILIVYGSDDKHALRNTVKGSSDSESIRLISANALFQLVKKYTEQPTKVVKKQIGDILRPKDFFSLDNLVELVFPEADIDIPDVPEESDDPPIKHDKPLLPSEDLKVGKFILTAMKALSDSGYVFDEEMMAALEGKDGINKVLGKGRHLPFFVECSGDPKQDRYINGVLRFYKDELSFGSHRVYLTKEWFAEDRAAFINWYKQL